jgi:hypothetical protein
LHQPKAKFAEYTLHSQIALRYIRVNTF